MNAHMQVHRACGQYFGNHDNTRCPDPFAPWYDLRQEPQRLAILYAWCGTRDLLTALTWGVLLATALFIAGNLLGIVR